MELSRRHEPVQRWKGSLEDEKRQVQGQVVWWCGRSSGAGEVSQILAGRKDGCCRSEKAVQNGRQLQSQARWARGGSKDGAGRVEVEVVVVEMGWERG